MSTHVKPVAASRRLEEKTRTRSFSAASEAEGLRLQIGFDSATEKKIVYDWLGAGLRPDRPGRLQQEFPLLFRRDASVFHLTLFDGFEPVAFCSLWAVHFRIGVNRLSVGLVSHVYTDPAARGRGFASRIVREAVARAEALKLGLVLLWSDLDSFYSSLGFVRTGCESLLIVDQSIIDRALLESRNSTAHEDHLEVHPAGQPDWAAIERLRGERTCQLELNPGEMSLMKSIPDMSAYVARDTKGVQGFAIRGRGDDFVEVIHEWGGRPDAVLRCCRSLVHDCEPESELFLLAPLEKTELSWSLRRAGAKVIRKQIAWMQIACAPVLADDLSRILPSEVGLEIKMLEPDSTGSIALSLRSSTGEVELEQAQFLSLLFGEAGNPDFGPWRKELQRALDASTPEDLPLPFFIWGMESI